MKSDRINRLAMLMCLCGGLMFGLQGCNGDNDVDDAMDDVQEGMEDMRDDAEDMMDDLSDNGY